MYVKYCVKFQKGNKSYYLFYVILYYMVKVCFIGRESCLIGWYKEDFLVYDVKKQRELVILRRNLIIRE